MIKASIGVYIYMHVVAKKNKKDRILLMVANISLSLPTHVRLLLAHLRGGLFLMAVIGAPQSLIVPPILGSPSSLVFVFVTNLSSKKTQGLLEFVTNLHYWRNGIIHYS